MVGLIGGLRGHELVVVPTRNTRIVPEIREFGFLTYPEFVDNGFCQLSYAPHMFKNFVDFARRNKDRIRVSVLWGRLVGKYRNIVWIAPIHRLDELKYVPRGAILGLPYDRGGYKASALLSLGEPVWVLGLKEGNWYLIYNDSVVGFDSVIPILYATRYGKLWFDFGRSGKPSSRMKNNDLAVVNVANFRTALEKRGFRLVGVDYLWEVLT